MFSLCRKYCIVPNLFCQGLPVPLLKKPTLDPTLPQHYRPVAVSCALSKLLELYILVVSGYHEFSDLHFEFVAERGTNMLQINILHSMVCGLIHQKLNVSYLAIVIRCTSRVDA